MFKSVTIDPEGNKLLCTPNLVGKGEIVEIHCLDDATPPQTVGRLMKKTADPNVFIVSTSFEGHEPLGREYQLGPKCIVRVLLRNLGGMRRRRFASDERDIVSTEKGENFKERRVVKAKTGSVRSKGKKKRRA